MTSACFALARLSAIRQFTLRGNIIARLTEDVVMSVQWSHLGIPLCLFNLHSPIRDQAKWDCKYYAGTCRHCGEQILRKERGVWRKAKARPA